MCAHDHARPHHLAGAAALPNATAKIPAMLHAMRVHQWSKNLLVFVPLISSQHYNLAAVLAAGGALFAFSFTSSSADVLKEIIDRDYSGADLPALLALAAAASVSAVVVFALHVPPQAVRGLYSNPDTLSVI